MWLLNWSAKSDQDAVAIWSGGPACACTEAVQLGVVAGSISKWLPSLLTQSENGRASTAGRLETLDVLLRARAGRHFSRTETWGFRVWVAALPQTAFLPFRSLSSVPFPASVGQAVSRAVAAGNNAQVSRLHQPELTSELLWASVFPWAKWGGHPHLLAKPTLTKHNRAAFSLGDVAA